MLGFYMDESAPTRNKRESFCFGVIADIDLWV
jgi:hypothetical protein